MNPVHVAAGCIGNDRGEILICQRPAHKIYPGEWEFPGGKVEPGETAEQALRRELREELSIEVSRCEPLTRLRHVYPELAVDLDVWRVTAYAGAVQSGEHPQIAWVEPQGMHRWNLLAANRPIVSALRLPGHYVFTPPRISAAELLPQLPKLPAGSLLRLRVPEVADAEYPQLAAALQAECVPLGMTLVLDRDLQLSRQLGCGWHASAAQLARLRERPVPAQCWFAASCHDAKELELARAAGADFAVLGPVLPTATHPRGRSLGWPGFAELAAAAGVPLYAIGGLAPRDLVAARRHGAIGVAGISAFWS